MTGTGPEYIMLICSMPNFFLSMFLIFYSHEFKKILMDKLFTARNVC